MVTDGRYLENVPIIDLRYNEPGFDIHLNWRAKSVRDRLLQANGHHDNQLIWAYDQTSTSAPSAAAFAAMDEWLQAMEADDSDRTLAEKVLKEQYPETWALVDGCLISQGPAAE